MIITPIPKNIRYNRVSTKNQSLERQIQRQHFNEVLYNDVVSGSVKFSEREKGKQIIKEIEAGEISMISVSSVDRLGRNLIDVLNTLEFCTQNMVNLKIDNLGIESLINGKPNPVCKMIISVLGNLAEMEKNNILERITEGINLAKAKGVYKGRVKGTIESDDVVLAKYKEVVKFLKTQSLRNTATLSGVSLGTVQKVKAILEKRK